MKGHSSLFNNSIGVKGKLAVRMFTIICLAWKITPSTRMICSKDCFLLYLYTHNCTVEPLSRNHTSKSFVNQTNKNESTGRKILSFTLRRSWQIGTVIDHLWCQINLFIIPISQYFLEVNYNHVS